LSSSLSHVLVMPSSPPINNNASAQSINGKIAVN
jgi:hypothetical protein